jgi:hypothetical protein
MPSSQTLLFPYLRNTPPIKSALGKPKLDSMGEKRGGETEPGNPSVYYTRFWRKAKPVNRY